MSETSHFIALDEKMVKAARKLKILTAVSWPTRVQDKFLAAWNRGNPQLPAVRYPKLQFKRLIQQFEQIQDAADSQHPVGAYLHDTATSYLHAALMLSHMGTSDFTKYSILLYGRPGDQLPGSKFSNIDAADHFVAVADEVSEAFDFHEGDYCVTAGAIEEGMRSQIDALFTRHTVDIAIDPRLTAKAAAGARRIRLRSGTCFTPLDLDQLLQHEAFVHTLTALNGREQSHLKSMGLGAPRTTATQEGLATFAELVTGVIDLSRLKRISLRIHAIDMALKGADFIDVFRFFLEAGQSQLESYQSAARVFRGGSPKGSIVFTKDTVYLHGLLATHTFFRKAMHNQELDQLRRLFAGRMTFEDVQRLAPFWENGFISEALYLPPWLERFQCLAAYLAFSVFANRICLEDL